MLPRELPPRLLPALAMLIGVAQGVGCGLLADETGDPRVELVGREEGQVRNDNELGMKLVWCPPGAFEMGDLSRRVPREIDVSAGAETERLQEELVLKGVTPLDGTYKKPVRVNLTRGFWIGMREVTQREWKTLTGNVPWRSRSPRGKHVDSPATFVCWDDAVRFCQAMTEQEREAGRLPDDWEYTLPTEAQWERACRARTESRFSFGDDAAQLGEYAWYAGEESLSDGGPQEVGRKRPNPWGLHDVHGNVWEFCRDSFSENHPGGRDPLVDDGRNGLRVIRGGCWDSPAIEAESSSRSGIDQTQTSSRVGLRVALFRIRDVR